MIHQFFIHPKNTSKWIHLNLPWWIQLMVKAMIHPTLVDSPIWRCPSMAHKGPWFISWKHPKIKWMIWGYLPILGNLHFTTSHKYLFLMARCYLSMWVQDIFIALQTSVIVCSRMLEMIGWDDSSFWEGLKPPTSYLYWCIKSMNQYLP